MFATFIFLTLQQPHITVKCVPYKVENRRFQYKCMQKVLRLSNYDDEARALQNFGIIDTISKSCAVCKWANVYCEGNEMKWVDWDRNYMIENLDLNWLPSTLQRVKLIDQRADSLETRFLPQKLRTLYVTRCGLYCALDFTTLPENLRELNLVGNRIFGMVRFTHLPTHMKQIDLRWNDIEKVVVHNTALPKSLNGININKERSNKPIHVVVIDGKKLDRRIQLSDDSKIV